MANVGDPGMLEVVAVASTAASDEDAIGPAERASAPTPGQLQRSPSGARRRSRADAAPPLDPRLRPFAHALAELLLADLLKYPPKP